MKKYKIIVLGFVCVLLCACQNLQAEKDVENMASYSLAVNKGSAVQPEVKHIPVPMPGQLMLKKTKKTKRLTGEAAIEEANKKSVKQPNSGEYINSIMTFDYMPGALYQIYCAPLSVTDVQFQNNEHLIAVGAGDTVRWKVTKAFSGIGANKQEHLFIKPVDEGLTNSIVVTTDLRTYHLMLHSTNKTYMASVAWHYSDGEDGGVLLNNLDDSAVDNGIEDISSTININRLSFNYNVKAIKGVKNPSWRPKMVFNDGYKTYIKFPSNMQEAPTLLVGTGKDNQVINYRVKGDYYIIDSVVYFMQLLGGNDKNQTIVQILPKGYK
jgi:P-type conjugative transfer protein TrbG